MTKNKKIKRHFFSVFDTGKPCNREGFEWISKGGCWDIPNKFVSFEDALKYADDWLGPCSLPENWKGSPYDYSGYGDLIEIRKVSE